ncbi:hypothetical protein VAE122_2980086 [Vibrio aestuarianus]|nr:hypothetical protein VAE122_2980086 [Vibrio aestuarianus]
MVEGDGFEPSKAEPADLQSAPFGHSGTPPGCFPILKIGLIEVFPTIQLRFLLRENMVEGDGFEPSKAEPADLQSAPFGHSGTPPGCFPILKIGSIEVFPTIQLRFLLRENMVEGDGFEPSKAEPADLQSAPFGHSGTPPGVFFMLLKHT